MTAHPDTPHSSDPRDALPDHLPALRAFAISLTGNVALADDMVQDTIVKAWSHIDSFAPGSNMRAWLFTILRNTFYSHQRKRKRELPDPEGIHAASLFEAPVHDSKLAMTDFRAAFAQLSDEHREVLLLIGASGFTTQEAAQMIGIAEGTVKSRASRARARLCALLGMADGEHMLDGISGSTAAVMSRSGTQAA
jgi:RNA polymerase sigma-70 factor (ECF subfamily)